MRPPETGKASASTGDLALGSRSKLDLDRLNDLADGIGESDHILSATSKYLCLTLLDLHAARYQWSNDGAPTTDTEWDEIQALIADATEELTRFQNCRVWA